MVENLAFAPATASQGYDPKLYTPAEDKKEYSMTWLEWASQNLTQIIKKGAGASSTLYKVPEGRILYITQSWLSVSSYIFPSNTINYKLHLGSGEVLVEHDQATSGAGDVAIANKGISNNYSMPIVVRSGNTIEITSTFNVSGLRCGFAGFIVQFK